MRARARAPSWTRLMISMLAIVKSSHPSGRQTPRTTFSGSYVWAWAERMTRLTAPAIAIILIDTTTPPPGSLHHAPAGSRSNTGHQLGGKSAEQFPGVRAPLYVE